MDPGAPADETADVEPSTTPTPDDDKEKKKKKKGGGYVLFPIKHVKLWDLYKTIEGGFWTAEDPLFLQAAPRQELDSPATRLVASLVAAIRGARFPEQLSSAIRDGEAACFLGFQAMQENVHLEAMTYLAATDPAFDAEVIALPPVDWPKTGSSNGPPNSILLRALESAATYAAASAVLCQVLLELTGDAVLEDITGRIERDYDLAYKFALATCPAYGEATTGNLEAVLEIGRAIAELVTSECNRAFPTYAIDMCSYFVHELEHEVSSYVPPPSDETPAKTFTADEAF